MTKQQGILVMHKRHLTLMIISVALISIHCAQNTGFLLEPGYLSPSFSGRDLSNSGIVLAPVLVNNGSLRSGGLSQERLLKSLQRSRKDLSLQSAHVFESRLANNRDSTLLEEFYQNLYKSELFSIKGADSVWSKLDSPLLLVFKIRSGVNIRTLNESNRRRIKIEGELWKRDNVEVVWRATVRGITHQGRKSDKDFIKSAIDHLIASIPAVKPGYGVGEW
ncbi:hypothetical protein QA601_06775 [Chitinispirillales bacterium ANBcel5]|uniref:hypothetical protein n=1 Tax=Cellulosispirillum alkaliphilum TaxID=3039283 RepID=UPI002A4EE280|nr:hypothetical protein [Chitinispirillales bacterium ANBcel5]